MHFYCSVNEHLKFCNILDIFVYLGKNLKMTFQEIIQQNKLVLVDFFATWCGPCKAMSPILEELKEKVGDSVKIIKIDVDKNQQVAANFSVRGVPTLILFKDGLQVWRESGVISAQQLAQIIQQHN